MADNKQKKSILGGKVFQDKSYGMVGINRVGCTRGNTSGGNQLFMSDVSVSNFMEITIKRAGVERALNHDWPFGEETLVTIQLSPVQFAELLTNMNCGDGVPCTISYTRQDGWIEYKPLPSKIDIIREEAKQQIEDCENSIAKTIKLLQEAADGKGYLGKGQIKDIIDTLKGAQYLYQNNDYAKRSAQLEIDKMVVEAKSQVAAYVDHKIYSTGLQALTEGFVTPQLNEGASTEDKDDDK